MSRISVGNSATRPSSSGRAMAQYGHSKSPYSSRVTGASSFPRIQSSSAISVFWIRSLNILNMFSLLRAPLLHTFERVEDHTQAGRNRLVLGNPHFTEHALRIDKEHRAPGDPVALLEYAV